MAVFVTVFSAYVAAQVIGAALGTLVRGTLAAAYDLLGEARVVIELSGQIGP